MGFQRDDQLRELQALAASTDYQDRQKAAVGLAPSADNPTVRALLVELVLDAEDTAVTLEASAALTKRGDRTGLEVLATALATADEQQTNWIETGIGDALGTSDDARDKAMATVRKCLTEVSDDAAVRGNERLLSLLRTAGLQ